MKIPNNYCPNCKRFKKWYQVTNNDSIDFGNCKHCGTKCVDTEEMLKKYVEKLINEGKCINADEITIDDEWMQDNKWDKIYKSEVEE